MVALQTVNPPPHWMIVFFLFLASTQVLICDQGFKELMQLDWPLGTRKMQQILLEIVNS